MMKNYSLIVVLLLILAACGAGNGVSVEMSPAIAEPVAEVWVTGGMAGGGAYFATPAAGSFAAPAPALSERMVIRNSTLSLNTTEFDYTTAAIENLVISFGGFIEWSNTWSRTVRGEEFWSTNYTLRIPSVHFDEMNTELMRLGTIIRFEVLSEDVTAQFQDATSRLNIRLEEEARILTMLEATDVLEELIALEARLADVRIIIESHRQNLEDIQHMVSFSTIELFLQEVDDDGIMPTFDGFFGQIGGAFGSSIGFSLALVENFFVLLASITLPLIILASPFLAIFLVIRRKNKA
ncbi:MAG: DUF4349 domain-containing protein [Turicibacter sp.]|nr:DUF4349 domain-containing protein [Turicibacter sp.]